MAKPWDEPLLTGHEQAKLERKMQKAAKLEAKRQAEQAKRDAESQKLEVLINFGLPSETLSVNHRPLRSFVAFAAS